MNSLKKPGQSWHIGIRTKAALGYAVTILKVRFLLRYIYSRLVEHAYRLRALGILTVTNVIAFASYQAFGLESLQSTELATIYAGAATMVGGVLAIVFTLSVFALQRAGDIYSARYYTVFTHDWKEKFIYAAMALLSIMLFAGAIAWSGANESSVSKYQIPGIFFALNATALTFSLIDRQYQRVRDRSNPLYAIDFLEGRARRQLRLIHEDAKRIAAVTKHLDEAPEDKHIGSAYVNYLGPALVAVNRDTEDLLEIVMRLSDRREIGSANIGLEAFARILSDYLHFRHDTSITVPSIEYFPAVTSDSQELIGRNLERLNAVGEECIRAHRESTAIAVLRAYDLLTEVATKMHFPRGNPVSSQVLGYLVDYLGIARREWQEEVVFRGVSSLQTLAVFVVRNGDDPATCAGALEEIDNIALGMIARGRFHLIDRCVDGWEQLILEIFGNKFHETEWLLEIILKSMSQLPLGILASPYAQTITHSSSVLTKPFDDMPQVINILAHEATHAKDEDHRRFYGVFLVHFLDDFNGHLINLTEEIKDCNGVIAAAVGRMIGNLSMILLPLIQHEGLKAPVHSDLRKELGWLLAGIPWRFVHYSNTVRGNSSALETLCEGIAMAGVKAQTMFIEDKLVADCIESVDALVND